MKAAARITKVPKRLTSAKPPEVLAFGVPVKQFTLDQYHRMLQSGFLPQDKRFELIDGYLLEQPVPNPPHSLVTQRLMWELLTLFPKPMWFVQIQDSITLSNSEPLPDVSVAYGPDSLYLKRHPGPKDLVLVIEVSDTSSPLDRGKKLSIYAAEKIAQYWIIDVNNRQIEVYNQARGGKSPSYRTCKTHGPGDRIPIVVDGKKHGEIDVSDLLP